MSRLLPRLHAVTDNQILALPDLDARARAMAGAGAVALHVRAYRLGGRRLVEVAQGFVRTGAVVLVNDRADLVRFVGAQGVHLPAEGLRVEAARRILGPAPLIGRSTHSATEARHAHEAGADYVFLGPIWETSSHPGRRPLGVNVIGEAYPARVIAIGGVTAERARIAREEGAYGVAAISALWGAPDAGTAAAEILLCLE